MQVAYAFMHATLSMGGDPEGWEGDKTPPLTLGRHNIQLFPKFLKKHQLKSTNFFAMLV